MSDFTSEQDVGMPEFPDRPNPPPAVNVGNNHGRFAFFAVILIVIAAWIYGLYLFGFIFTPTNTLADGNYIRTEVNFNLIPVLPDSLAESYDLLREEQLANIEAMGMSAEMGMARIPIDDAIDFMLENGGFPVGDDAAIPAEPDEDTGDPAIEEDVAPEATEEAPTGFQEIDATSEEVTPEPDAEGDGDS